MASCALLSPHRSEGTSERGVGSAATSITSSVSSSNLQLALNLASVDIKAVVARTRSAIKEDRESGFSSWDRLSVLELDSSSSAAAASFLDHRGGARGKSDVGRSATPKSGLASLERLEKSSAESVAVTSSFAISGKKTKKIGLFELLQQSQIEGNWQKALGLFQGGHSGVTVVRDLNSADLSRQAAIAADAANIGTSSNLSVDTGMLLGTMNEGCRFEVRGNALSHSVWQWFHVRTLCETLLTQQRLADLNAVLSVLSFRKFFFSVEERGVQDALARFAHWGLHPLNCPDGSRPSSAYVLDLRRSLVHVCDEVCEAGRMRGIEFRAEHHSIRNRLRGIISAAERKTRSNEIKSHQNNRREESAPRVADHRAASPQPDAAVRVSDVSTAANSAVGVKASDEEVLHMLACANSAEEAAGFRRLLTSMGASPSAIYAAFMQSILRGNYIPANDKCAKILSCYKDICSEGVPMTLPIVNVTLRALMQHIPSSDNHRELFATLLRFCRFGGGDDGRPPMLLLPTEGTSQPPHQPLRREVRAWHVAPNVDLYAVLIAYYSRLGDHSSCWKLFGEMKNMDIIGTAPIYRTMLRSAAKDPGPHDTTRDAIVALEAMMRSDGIELSSPQDMVTMINAWTSTHRRK